MNKEQADRILHVMWNMDIGGAERAVYQLIREQRKTGLDSNVMILNNTGLYGGLTRDTGAEVFFMKMSRSFDKRIKKAFLDIAEKFDLIHFHSAEPYPIYLSTLNKKIKKFYTHRGGVYPYSFIKSVRYKYCGRLFRKYFTGISGNTSEGARAASLLFKIPVHDIAVTYNGLDFSLLEPKRSKEEIRKELNIGDKDIIVGTSANLKKWKRVDYLIKSVPYLKNSNVKILILGDGQEMENLRNLASELGVTESVIFAGKKKIIADYLQVTDIFVLASESLESFGNSAVEAMATGIPTIVMKDGGGLPEHVIDGETGYIAADFEDMITKLNRLVSDTDLRSRLGKASRTHIREKYSLNKMIQNYNKLYRINETTLT